MATPVIDLRWRLRNAGVSEEQADAGSGAYKALCTQIADLAIEVRSVIIGRRIKIGLLLVVAAATLAPYVGSGK